MHRGQGWRPDSLSGSHLRKQSPLADQFIETTRFHNCAFVQHDNSVHGRQSRQSMRDANDRPMLGQVVDGHLDLCLRHGVQRAGGLVQDENRCIPDEGPRPITNEGQAEAVGSRQ